LPSASGKYVVLYDGRCRFCQAQSKNLTALARPGAIELVDFQQPGVLEHFPRVTHEACMQAMHLITPTGRIYRGFEAAVQAVATRPVLGLPAYLYYVPGIRQVCDRFYRWLAAHRYRLLGNKPADACPDGTCALHGNHPLKSHG
jgi:predicted DCC family thiol-disulfide oxidoreductase YuxK